MTPPQWLVSRWDSQLTDTQGHKLVYTKTVKNINQLLLCTRTSKEYQLAHQGFIRHIHCQS